MRFNREQNGSDCTHCPLRDRKRVYSEGPSRPTVATLTEAPGVDEDAEGRPLVGAAGAVYHSVTQEAGMRGSQMWKMNVICCFAGDSYVQATDIQTLFRRWYVGPWIVVHTDRGVLAGTPNHPTFSSRGWCPLHHLTEGDYVIGGSLSQGMSSGNPDVHHPTTFKELFDTLTNTGVRERMVGCDMDFHGDGSTADVDIVHPNHLLWHTLDGTLTQQQHEMMFKTAYVSLARSVPLSTHGHTATDLLIRLWRPTSSGVRRVQHPSTIRRSGTLPTCAHCGRPIPNHHPVLHQEGSEAPLSNTKSLREGLNAFPVEVTPHRILHIERTTYSGHVYNLHTRSNKYITDGCIVHNCRPPNNDISHPESLEAIERCRPGLEAELRFIKDRGVRTLMPMGNTALTALGMEEGILSKRGSVYGANSEDNPHPFTIVPTFHPSYIQRGNWHQKPVMVADVRKAIETAADGWEPPAEHFNLFPTIAELEEITHRLVTDRALTAIDTETTNFRCRYGDIVVACLAWSPTEAVAVPFRKQGGKPYWRNGEHSRAMDCLRAVLSTCPTMYQNALFDVPWLEYHVGPVADIRHDTLILHHAIDPELPHNLGFIVSTYGSTPYWKDRFKNRAGTLYQMDDTDLRRYCARDTVVLHQVLQPMMEDVVEDGLESAYTTSIGATRSIVNMAEAGMLVDKDELKRWKKELKADYARLEKEIRTTYSLPDPFNFASDDDLRLLFYGYVAPKFHDAEDKHNKRLSRIAAFEEKGKPASADRIRNTAAWAKDLGIVQVHNDTTPLYSAVLSPPTTNTTARPAVNAQALLSLQIQSQARLGALSKLLRPRDRHVQEREHIESFLHFLSLYRQWAKVDKLRSTYTKFRLDPDGRVRSRFSQTSTRSARLSSSDPNLENQPPASRRVFISAPGHKLIECDYSNLELRILAILSGDERSLSDFADGLNVHTENTKRMWGIDESDPRWDACRLATKRYVFGRNYGGGLLGIYEKVAMDVPELGLTFDWFKKVDAAYRAAHPQETEWRSRHMKLIEMEMRAENAFGRVRVFRGQRSNAIREGINHKIQSTAADMMLMVMTKLNDRLGDAPVHLINQVHDSLIFEVAETAVDLALEDIRAVMEHPFPMADKGNWIFPMEAKIGTRWSELEKVTA